MANLSFQKAKREQVRIKVSIAGPAGSGKTMSALLMAYGLTRAEFPNLSEAEIWEKIVVIDTENSSASLYVGKQVGATTIGEYNVINLTPPFEPQVFVDAIHMAEQHGMNVIIIDSLSHAWAGVGGALDQQGAIAARSGNSWTAWRSVTPQHNKLVDAMLQSPAHVIANMRAKMDYEQVTGDNGKKQVKAVGMGVVMRDGIEYEFTCSFMLDYEHRANSTKDRTGLFDGKYFIIDPNTGKQMYQWLSTGAKPSAPATTVPEPQKATPAEDSPAPVDAERVAKAIAAVDPLIKAAVQVDKEAALQKVVEILGDKNYLKCTDINKLTALYKAFKE